MILIVKMPIFYAGIMNIEMNTSSLSYGILPYAYELDFLQVVNDEINRIKFII